MADKRIRIELEVSENLEGLNRTRSALDTFSSSTTRGLSSVEEAAVRTAQAFANLGPLSRLAPKVVQDQFRALRDQQQQLTLIASLYEKQKITHEEFENSRVAITQAAEARRVEAVKVFGRTLESLYERTIGRSRTFAEALGNIWREITTQLKRNIFDSIAAILLNQRQALAAFGPSGIGTDGPVLPGLPVGLGGFGGSSTPLFQGSPFISRAFDPAGTPGRAAGASQGRLVNFLSAIATAPGFRSLPLLLGLGLGGRRGASPLGAALGAFGGIAAGFAGAGAVAGVIGGIGVGAGALGGLAALFSNPLTAGIAAGLVGFMALRATFARGRIKREASGIADQGFGEIRRIFEDYKNYRRDYGSALADMQQVWAGMVAQWSAMGGVGARSIRTQEVFFRQYLNQMAQIEEERGIRGNIIRSLPAPSFQAGGFSTGGGLAFLHPGEFVLSNRAVERLGASLLQGLNSGTAGQGGGEGMMVELTPASAAILKKMIKLDPAGMDEGLMMVVRAGGKFSRAVRG